jgi:hypothetical protein
MWLPGAFAVLLAVASDKSLRSSASGQTVMLHTAPFTTKSAIHFHVKKSSHPIIEQGVADPMKPAIASTQSSAAQAGHAQFRARQGPPAGLHPSEAGTKLGSGNSHAFLASLMDDGWASDDEAGEEIVKQVDKQGAVLHKAVIRKAVIKRKKCVGC